MGDIILMNDDGYLDVPNYPDDLVRMEPTGEPGAEHRQCPECGLVRLP
jgi:hypothetical protein